MRNLKRVLSLALASVMLLGMMVVGTSAADFVDADDIKNEKAATITAGLGIFAGKTVEGGETAFDPTAVVRRSEMAAIICKILYGADLDANIYKGEGKFSDVADFEGGWAEGYINLCSSLGIVDGYAGTTKFGPNDPVKASEAAVMLAKALGYFKNDAEYGTRWDVAAMDKARNLNILDGVVVTKDEGLTRDNVAAMVYNAITKAVVVEYNTAFQTYYNVGSNWAAGVDNSRFADTLGSRVFTMNQNPELVIVVKNKDTGYDTKNTTRVYPVEVGDDGKITRIGNSVAAKKFNSSMADLGSVVELYSTTDGTIYATRTVSRKATVEKALTDGNSTDKAKLKAALGVSTLAKAAEQVALDKTYAYSEGSSVISGITTGAAAKGTYVLYKNEVVSYIPDLEDLTVTASKVEAIVTTAGSETISLAGVVNSETGALAPISNKSSDDNVKEYDGIKKGDIVTYVKHGDIYVLTKAPTVEGKVTRIENDDNGDVKKLTVNGTTYTVSGVADNSGISDGTADFTKTFTLYLTPDNKFFAVVEKEGDDAVQSDIVYVVGKYTVAEANDYGVATYYTYAQVVGLDGAESSVLVGVKVGASGTQQGTATPSNGLFTFALSSTAADAKLGIMTATPAPTTYNKTTAPIYKQNVVSDASLDKDSFKISVTGDNAYLTADTKFIFIDGNEGTELDIEVVTGTITGTVTAGRPVLLTKDADKNTVVVAIFIKAGYTPGAESGEDYIYVADAQSTPAQVGTNKYEYTVYDAVTGEKKTITATNATIAAAGFYTYTIADGVYTVAAEKVAEGDAVKYGEAYASKFGTKISTSDLTDAEAGSAIIVDTRTSTEISTSKLAAVKTLDDINAGKLASTPKTAVFDCLVGENGVTIIFVTGPTTAP